MRAGYRLFADDDIAVLRFIRQAKTLGLTLAEINDILSLQRGGAQPCGRVTPLLDSHIDRTLAELRQLRRALLTARRPPALPAGPAVTLSSAESSKPEKRLARCRSEPLRLLDLNNDAEPDQGHLGGPSQGAPIQAVTVRSSGVDTATVASRLAPSVG